MGLTDFTVRSKIVLAMKDDRHSDSTELPTERITAKVLSQATGLSYRMISDWDRRGMLPHTRASKRGWREFTLHQVLAVRILSDVRLIYSTPLWRLESLLGWLLGKPWDDTTYEEYDESFRTPQILRSQEQMREINTEHWPAGARRFFLDVASARPSSLDLTTVMQLSAFITEGTVPGESEQVREAVWRIVRTCFPIWHCLLVMAAGRMMYLCTDLYSTFWFLEEPYLGNAVADLAPLIVYPANPYLNIALEALGRRSLPLEPDQHMSADQLTQDLTIEEWQVISALREEAVKSVTVRRKGARIVGVKQRKSVDTSKRDPQGIMAELLGGPPGTYTLKTDHGKIMRVEETRERTDKPKKRSRRVKR